MVGRSFVDTGKAFSFGGVGGRTAEVDMLVLIWAKRRFSSRVWFGFHFLGFLGFLAV